MINYLIIKLLKKEIVNEYVVNYYLIVYENNNLKWIINNYLNKIGDEGGKVIVKGIVQLNKLKEWRL